MRGEGGDYILSDPGNIFTPDYRGTGISGSDYVETSRKAAKRITRSLCEAAGEAVGREDTGAMEYAEAVLAIDLAKPAGYEEQLKSALKKASLDIPVPEGLKEDCGLTAFVSLLVRAYKSGDDKLGRLVSSLSSALAAEGLSLGYLTLLRERVLDDSLLSYVLEPEAPKRVKEIVWLFKEGADPTRKYGEGRAVDVMIARGYLDLFRRAAGFDKCRDAVLDAAISYPAVPTPDSPEGRRNAERVLYYAFSSLIPPTYDDGRFFRLCVMHKKWRLAKLGMKAFVGRGGNAAALADYLVSTVGDSKGSYCRMFSSSLRTAELGYEILRSIAREAASEGVSGEVQLV